ncbi:MAG TPA: energy transducer TonB [Hanamia sp.]|nr:energy transducer TonB [Hanamia sp.]
MHAQTQIKDSSKNTVLEKVEVEASFPGGPQAWTKYITNAIKDNIDKLRRSDYGTCIIRFIVDTKGRVSDVKAMTMKKSRLAKIAIDAISNGPTWNPAQQNGKFVNAYRLQPVTLMAPDK